MYRIIIPCADLKAQPDIMSGTETQILFGEIVIILNDTHNDFYYVLLQQNNDNYQGYILKSNVQIMQLQATHRTINRTLLFHQADIKSPNPLFLSIGACLTVTKDISNTFYRDETGYYILKKHIMPIDTHLKFSVNAWIEFLIDNFYNTPYLWGGRSSAGIDCSGLVQLSLQAFGIFLPRDSKPQQDYLTHNGNINHLTKGNLIFWAGHVGIMVNNTDLIHANAFHMKTLIEPVIDVITRNSKPVSAVKII